MLVLIFEAERETDIDREGGTNSELSGSTDTFSLSGLGWGQPSVGRVDPKRRRHLTRSARKHVRRTGGDFTFSGPQACLGRGHSWCTAFLKTWGHTAFISHGVTLWPVPRTPIRAAGAGSASENQAREKRSCSSLHPLPQVRGRFRGLVLQEEVRARAGGSCQSSVSHSQPRPFDF